LRRRERGCGKKSVFRVSRRSAEETASFDTLGMSIKPTSKMKGPSFQAHRHRAGLREGLCRELPLRPTTGCFRHASIQGRGP
jgi:hypothetical protein